MFRIEIFFDEMIDKINQAGIMLDETKIRVNRKQKK